MQRLIAILLIPICAVGPLFCSHADLCGDANCATHRCDFHSHDSHDSHSSDSHSHDSHANDPHATDSDCPGHSATAKSTDRVAARRERSNRGGHAAHSARPHIHLAGKHSHQHGHAHGHAHGQAHEHQYGHDHEFQHAHEGDGDDAYYFPCGACGNRGVQAKRVAGIEAPVACGLATLAIAPRCFSVEAQGIQRADDGGPPLYLRVSRLRI